MCVRTEEHNCNLFSSGSWDLEPKKRHKRRERQGESIQPDSGNPLRDCLLFRPIGKTPEFCRWNFPRKADQTGDDVSLQKLRVDRHLFPQSVAIDFCKLNQAEGLVHWNFLPLCALQNPNKWKDPGERRGVLGHKIDNLVLSEPELYKVTQPAVMYAN